MIVRNRFICLYFVQDELRRGQEAALVVRVQAKACGTFSDQG